MSNTGYDKSPYEKLQSVLKSDRPPGVVKSTNEKLDFLLERKKFNSIEFIINLLKKIDRFIFKPRGKNIFNTRYHRR